MTLLEAYQKLPKTVAQKAIRNIKKRPITFKEVVMTLDSRCHSVQDALLNFEWESSEGTGYWLKQYKKAKDL